MATQSEFTDARVRFGRMERRGVLLGLGWPQLILVGAICFFAIILLFLKLYVEMLVLAPVLLLAIVLGVGRWHREPILFAVLKIFTFTRRLLTKQNIAVGGPDAAGAASRVGKLNLAGGLASIEMNQIEGGGAFLYDTARKRFTFTLSCDAPSWPLEDVADQAKAVGGFVRFLNGMTRISGLALVDIQVRADFSGSTVLEDYVDDQVRLREESAFPEVACPNCDTVGTTRYCNVCGTLLRAESVSPLAWVDDQARIAARDLSASAMEFSYYLVFALDLGVLKDRRLPQRIKRGGGGLTGIANVVSLEANSLARSLSSSGVTNVQWLTSDELTGAVRLAYDPETVIAKKRAGASRKRVSPDSARPMAQQESWDHLRIDETYHQVFWITEWPTSDVPLGFLEELLINGGDFTRVVTLQMKPVSKEKALKRIQSAQTDLDAASATREKIGQRETREQQAEADEVSAREDDISEGYRDLEFRGYVTISAASRELLDEARNAIEVAAQEVQIEVRPLYFQQAAAFNTAALPLGLGSGKR